MTAAAPTRATTAWTDRCDRWIDVSWRALGSPRFALWLIFGFAGAALIGAAIMQAPPPALSNPDQYELWLGEARNRYGAWTPLLDRMQCFRVFQSFWFRGLVVLLVVSILFSTLRRLRGLAIRARVRARDDGEWVGHARLDARFTSSRTDTAEVARSFESVLRTSRFRVEVHSAGDGAVISGDRHRLTRAIGAIYHLGLVIVLAGAFFGARGGFTDTQFVVTEGSERAVEHGTGLAVRLESFADEYYAEDAAVPSDYRSEIVLLDHGNEVKRGTVRVNEPLRYGRLRIHQAYYGPAVAMRVTRDDGRALLDEVVPLTWRADGRPAGSIQIPGSALQVFVLAPAGAYRDPVIQPGEVRLELYASGGSQPLAVEHISQGGTETVSGLRFSFERESRFTGLIVINDPGLPVVWLGAGIFLVGAAVSLFLPYRRVRIWLRPASNGAGTEVRIVAPARRGRPFDREFVKLAARLEAAADAPARTDARRQGAR